MDETADGSSVLAEDHGQVRVLTLNRPDRRNAIDLGLRVVLAEALEGAMADDAVRGRLQAAQRVIRAIWRGPKPVLAAVEGYAFGAGAALVLACDRVVTAADAVLGLTFTGVGLAGDMGIFASLAAGPPLALTGIKARLASWPADPGETLEREVDLAVTLMDTEDFAEGIAAFGERCQPAFRGR